VPRVPPKPCDRALTSEDAMEEIMRIGRNILIPAILALSAAGSILASSAVPAAVAAAPSAHVQTTVSAMSPNSLYNW